MDCPAKALSDSTLPAGARLVLVALWAYAGREARFVWPSRSRLASDVGMADRTVRKHLATLRERGWVVEDQGANGQSGWCLCDPPGVIAHRSSDEDPARSGQDERHVQTEDAAQMCREGGGDRHVQTAIPARSDRPFSMEPTKNTLSKAREQRPEPAIDDELSRERKRRQKLARFRELTAWGRRPRGPNGSTLAPFTCPDTKLLDLIDQGWSPENMAEVVAKAALLIDEGKLERKFWGALLASGWWSAVANGEFDDVEPAKVEPKFESREEAEAHAWKHGGKLPSGWYWEQDARGNQWAVRE